MILAELRYDIRKLDKDRQKAFEAALVDAHAVVTNHGDLGSVALQIALLEVTVMQEDEARGNG